MKFTCLQENLAKGLSIVTKAVPTKASLPILSNVLITSDEGRLKLSTNNLETAITVYVGASIDSPGSITVPAKLLGEFISNLSSETVEVSLEKDVLQVKSGKTKSKFNGADASDFPPLPVVGKETLSLEIPADIFSESTSKVTFSAALDDSRPVLAGVLLTFSKGLLTVVSTDGFRLSEKSVKVKSDLDDFSVIVPAKTLQEVSRIFSGTEEPVTIMLNNNDNLALFESGDVTVATRILDGEFPDYKKIIPSEFVVSAEFETKELVEALKLANVFAKEVDNVIKVAFDPNGFIRVTSISKESGENSTEIEADVKGDLVESAFSSKYLLEFFNSVKSNNFLFESNGNLAPGVLKSLEDKNYLHIIMPMRIQD